jgi:uncharacterized RDD family membrane protein YckC
LIAQEEEQPVAHPAPDQRYAPPQAQVEDMPVRSQDGELATRGRRFVAAMVDGLLAMGATVPVASALGLDLFAPESQTTWTARLLGGVIGLLVFAAIHAYPLLRRGQTLGKMLLKIRIARPDGSPASPGRLALRYGIAIPLSAFPHVAQIYAVVDCLAIFRRSRRCLHDNIADTVVLKL